MLKGEQKYRGIFESTTLLIWGIGKEIVLSAKKKVIIVQACAESVISRSEI
jgi:hypothetical protein